MAERRRRPRRRPARSRARRASGPARAPRAPARAGPARAGRRRRARPRSRSCACSRSRSSALPIRRAERLRMLATLSSSRSWTRTWRSCSSSRRCSSSSLVGGGLLGALGARLRLRLLLVHRARRYKNRASVGGGGRVGGRRLVDRLAVDVDQRRPLLRAGAVPAGRRSPTGSRRRGRARAGPARSTRGRPPAPRGLHHPPRGEVDLASRRARGGSPARGSPRSRAGAAASASAPVVVVERRLGDAGDDQRGEVEGLVAARLRVADPQLDGAEGVMRAHAPPQLGRLDDPPGRRQQVDEVGVGRSSRRTARGPRSAGRCG